MYVNLKTTFICSLLRKVTVKLYTILIRYDAACSVKQCKMPPFGHILPLNYYRVREFTQNPANRTLYPETPALLD